MTTSTHELIELRYRLQRLRNERVTIEKKLQKLDSKFVDLKPQRNRTASRMLLRAAADARLVDVRKQLKRGADADFQDKYGSTALLSAAYLPKNIKVVRELLRHDADPNLADREGNTPLIIAADDERIQMVQDLVSAGADVNARNSRGDTPLTNAACWGARKVVKLLLENGADPDLADGEGVGPADLARQQSHTALADFIEGYQKGQS